MLASAQDFRYFYKTKLGRVVRRTLKERIAQQWGQDKDKTILGLGYAVPYLSQFSDDNQILSFMNAESGVHHWPVQNDTPNKNALVHMESLPLPPETIDGILMVHHLEYIQKMRAHLQEVWHILKPGGKLMIIVPNRHGSWAKAEDTPFGTGMPFGRGQILHYLKDNDFDIEHISKALFFPPSQIGVLLKLSASLENLTPNFLPMLGGVHIIEATKQLYAPRGGTAVPSQKALRMAGLFPASAS